MLTGKNKVLDIIIWVFIILYLIGILFCIFILPTITLGWKDGLITTTIIILYIGYLAYSIK